MKKIFFIAFLLVAPFILTGKTLAAAKYPDLVISSVKFERNTTKPKITIRNRGNAIAKPAEERFNIVLEFKWLGAGGELKSSVGGLAVPNLAPGQSYVFDAWKIPTPTEDLYTPMPGAEIFLATIDTENVIDEGLNENNNEWRGTFPKPDLVVTSVVFDREANRPRITIKNIGGGPAKPSLQEEQEISGYLEWQDNQGNLVVSSNFQLPTILPGKSFVVDWWKNPLSDVTIPIKDATKLKVVIDPDNKIDEGNKETNNQGVFVFPKPDLVVSSVIFDREANRPKITIRNRGKGPFNLLYGEQMKSTLTWIDKDRNLVVGSSFNVPSHFKPGESFVLDMTQWPISDVSTPILDAVALKINLDIDNQVVEGDGENNNEFIKFFFRPDLTIKNAKFTDKELSVSIKNQGNGPAAAIADLFINPLLKWVKSDGSVQEFTNKFSGTKSLKSGKSLIFKEKISSDSVLSREIFSPPAGAVALRLEIDSRFVSETRRDNNAADLAIPNTLFDYLIEPVDSSSVDEETPLTIDETSGTTTPSIILPVVLPTSPDNSSVEQSVTPSVSNQDVSEPPAATVTPTPAPVVEERVREPKFTIEVTQNGNNATVTGRIEYWGKGSGCTGPRPNDPVIVRWGDGANEPIVSSDGTFSASHMYHILNKTYNLSVSAYSSCYGMTTINKTMTFTF